MAAQETKSWKTGAITVGVFAILGFAGLAGIEQIAGGLVCVLGITLRMALATLPSILLRALPILQPCAFGHLRLLGGLLQVSASWKLVLMLTGA